MPCKNVIVLLLLCLGVNEAFGRLQRRVSTEAPDRLNHIDRERETSHRHRFEEIYQQRLKANNEQNIPGDDIQPIIPERFSTKTKNIFGKKAASTLERKKRSVVINQGGKQLRSTDWGHTEWFGNGQVALEWKTKGDRIVFRVQAKAERHVGLSINSDAVMVWFEDDGSSQISDCHLESGIPVQDASQDYELLFALQNYTHIITEFQRPLDTCDFEDVTINSEPVKVQWTLGNDKPFGNRWKGWKGTHTLRILNPKAPAPGATSKDYKRWDVVIQNLKVPEYMATVFWVKIFKVPQLSQKHHIVGYRPVGEFGPAGHAVLYECAVEAGAEGGQWDHWALGNGSFIVDMPHEWTLCLSPVATWAIGSKGEMFPDHVGIPLGGSTGVTYYMLEIHYENQLLQKVVDDFGLTILYTDELRPHDAGVMVSGITVSALHVLPADQPVYRSAGYCAEPCTSAMFPETGINIVSVLLHAHTAKRKLSLRHIRNGEELPKVAEDEYYTQNKNTQSRVLLDERNVLPGDSLITECVYNTQGRQRPTLGGYSSKQEMCLAFILHYPRIPLAGCYSMTPVKEFFETFGVKEFYSINMKDVENIFLAPNSLDMFASGLDFSSKPEVGVQGDDQGVGVLSHLVIKEPFEFRNKTFIAHLNEIPWGESLLTKRIEDTLYKGKHMTFCKKRDDTLAIPIEIRIFPNFTETLSTGSTLECLHKLHQKNSTSSSNKMLYSIFNLLSMLTVIVYIRL